MSIATLLTQPQIVEKLQAQSTKDTLGEDLIALVRRIMLNTEKSRVILDAFEDGFKEFADDFVENAPDFDGGLQQLAGLIAPFIQGVRDFGENEALTGDFPDLVEFLAAEFIALMDVITSLSINDIRGFITRLLSILENQFGFSLENIVNRLWSLFDAVIAQLRDFELETESEERELRLVTAGLLARVKRILQEKIDLPDLGADTLSAAIMRGLRDLGLNGWMQNAAELAEALKNVCIAAGSIGEIIQLATGSSVGAAARTPGSGDTYCWYASWLLATRKRNIGESLLNFFVPDDEVSVSEDKTQVIWRTVYDGDICLHEGENLSWLDAPMFSTQTGAEYVLFPHISGEALELLSHLTYALTEFGKGIWNSVDAAERGDRASAITHAIWNYFNSGFSALGSRPFTSYLNASAGWPQANLVWMDYVFPIIGTALPSIEGRQTEADVAASKFWMILLADDVLERAGHHLLLHTVRDFLLSNLTLINNINQAQGSDDSHPINREYIDTWGAVCAQVATIVYLKTIFNKKDYEPSLDAFLWTFASMLAGLTGGLVGSLLGSALAVGFSPKAFAGTLVTETAKPLILHFLNLYSWIENDTEGGTWNGDRDAFAGYPEKTNSPYKLPWENGITRMCVQGNMGLWSHYDALDQIYAVDFGFDQADLIHAARGGTVVGYIDTTANDTENNGNWNYIVIRHDHPTESDAVRRIHDVYHDGTPYITYGVYGHGRTNGVTEVFADRGVAAADIRGTRVEQGDPIMKAGNTGISLHNHLHFHVKNNGEPLGTPGPTAPIPNLDPGTLSGDSMPFVFQDVDDDGVVKSLAFYTSRNGAS